MNEKIEFICDYINKRHYHYNDLINYKFYELVNAEDEATFSIIIKDKVFFLTEGFNILEFLQQIAKWEIIRGDMIYNCIDTEDNPLISFVEENGLYRIYSPWQNFECKNKFRFGDLISVKNIL